MLFSDVTLASSMSTVIEVRWSQLEWIESPRKPNTIGKYSKHTLAF